jgi:hypothetical protein
MQAVTPEPVLREAKIDLNAVSDAYIGIVMRGKIGDEEQLIADLFAAKQDEKKMVTARIPINGHARDYSFYTFPRSDHAYLEGTYFVKWQLV